MTCMSTGDGGEDADRLPALRFFSQKGPDKRPEEYEPRQRHP